MKLKILSSVKFAAIGVSIVAAAMAQSTQPSIGTTRADMGTIPTNVADAQRTATAFAPLPAIDNGPRDLIPTELYLNRSLTADFGGQYTQQASVYLPIYYHAGYLALSSEDQAELRRMEQEFGQLINEADAFNRKLGDFLERYQALCERGRPKGVIQQAQMLVPYAGESKVKDPVDPLRLVRKSSNSQPSASTVTSSLNATPVNPVGIKSK